MKTTLELHHTAYILSMGPFFPSSMSGYNVGCKIILGCITSLCFQVQKKQYPFPGRSIRDTRVPIEYMSSSQNFLLRYAPDCTFSSRKMKKLPTVGGETPPSHTLPPLGRYAPSGLVASLPRKDCAPPQMFWLITCSRPPTSIKLTLNGASHHVTFAPLIGVRPAKHNLWKVMKMIPL